MPAIQGPSDDGRAFRFVFDSGTVNENESILRVRRSTDSEAKFGEGFIDLMLDGVHGQMGLCNQHRAAGDQGGDS